MRIQLKALTAYWQKSSARKNPATANAHIAENDEKYTSVAFYSLPVLWGFYDVRFKRQQKLNELQKLQNQLHQLSPRSSNEYNSTYPHPATHSQAAKNRFFFRWLMMKGKNSSKSSQTPQWTNYTYKMMRENSLLPLFTHIQFK